MVVWHHQLNRHEFEQTPGDGDGQGGLACCSPWSHRELDTTRDQTTTRAKLPEEGGSAPDRGAQALKRIPNSSTGFPGSSVGKESACNVGDLGSIPGLG